MKIQVPVLWVVTACSHVAGHLCFEGPCCLHLELWHRVVMW